MGSQRIKELKHTAQAIELPGRYKIRCNNTLVRIYFNKEKKFEFESAGTSTVAASDPKGGKKVDEERRTLSTRGFSGGKGGLQITSWRNINRKCQAAWREASKFHDEIRVPRLCLWNY